PADIATAKGNSVSGLEDVIVADAKTQLDAAVTAGKITAAEESTRLADLTSHMSEVVNRTGPPRGVGHAHGPFDMAAVTDYLGISRDALRTQLQAGKTLADVATAQGKSVSGLEDAIVASANTRLDAAVSAGKLTADQESSMLSNLQSTVADLVNRSGPPVGRRGPHLGPS